MKILSVLVLGVVLAVSSTNARPDGPPPPPPTTVPPPPPTTAAPPPPPPPKPNKSYAWTLIRPGRVPARMSANGIVAGIDGAGHFSYVGRSFSGKEVVPGKVTFDGSSSFIADKDNKEVQQGTFEVLLADDITWVYGSHGSVPEGAIQTGQTESGAPLFTCRSMQKDLVMVSGKLDIEKKVCVIPFNGQALTFDEYEVLFVH